MVVAVADPRLQELKEDDGCRCSCCSIMTAAAASFIQLLPLMLPCKVRSNNIIIVKLDCSLQPAANNY
jgi:hypothetical protein